jgi:aspartokinase
MLKWARPLKIEKDLVELHIIAPPEFWDMPGIIYTFTKQLAMDGINIIDIVSTTTEFSILVRKDDAGKAFEVFNKMIEDAKK